MRRRECTDQTREAVFFVCLFLFLFCFVLFLFFCFFFSSDAQEYGRSVYHNPLTCEKASFQSDRQTRTCLSQDAEAQGRRPPVVAARLS